MFSRIGEKKTRSFSYSRRVRQGFILSPLSFNLYISNLPYLFENTLSDPFVLPNGTVQEYTYLSTRLAPTGNVTLALEHLKEKALHAFSTIRKQTLLNGLNPNTASQIFDTVIFLILSYNSESWGMYTK